MRKGLPGLLGKLAFALFVNSQVTGPGSGIPQQLQCLSGQGPSSRELMVTLLGRRTPPAWGRPGRLPAPPTPLLSVGESLPGTQALRTHGWPVTPWSP